MKPQRPDSAKSAKTRITIDSEVNSTNITHSRFSQTYSNGVKLNSNKNNQFEKYVAEKDKDPKFKKFMENNLPEIPQKVKHSTTELSKLTSKPFDKKITKLDKQKVQKKIQQPPNKIQQDFKTVKKENLQSSKTFMDKSKQKFKIPSKQDIEQPQHKQQKKQNIQQNTKKDTKINLNGFVLNIPGKGRQIIKQEKKQQKAQQTKQQKQKRQRQKVMTQISQFIQQIQQKNIDYLPRRYGQFINRNHNKDEDIDTINIQDFLEPNQRDYQNLMKKINQNQKQLQSSQKPANNVRSLSNSSLSINLQQIIDGSQIKKQQEAQQSPDDVSVIMSSMSASDYKDRNMFLTQILKGKRLTKQQLSQIKQNDNIMMKLVKLEDQNKQQQQDDDDVEIVQINMNKKKSNKIMQRNKIEAAGQLYRQCDYLTPEQQQRIQQLLNTDKIYSPFERTQMQNLMMRSIDEGINLHRKLYKDIEGLTSTKQEQVVIDQTTLPKDPTARKKAQLKILREKINSINSRLSTVNNDVVVNKNKIQNLVNKYKQIVRPSKMSQSIIEQKNKQIQQQRLKLKQAQSILKKTQSQKQQINNLLQQMTLKFKDMQKDLNRLQKMDSEQKKKLEQDELKQKKKKIEQVQKQARQFQLEIQSFLTVRQDLKRKMQILDQIISTPQQQMKCQGYKEGQTIEDLDRLVTIKWEAAEQAVRNIPNETQ